MKAYSLAALAAFDSTKLPSAQNLGAECLRQIQDLQIAHWGSENLRILQEDTIQTLIMGANHLLDFSLSMEKTIIDLRQSALWTYNIALGGQACGKLLDLLENIFGYPETRASKDFEATLWPYSLLDPEHEPEVEEAANPNQAGTSGEGIPKAGSNTICHRSLKRQASTSFETPPGKGKAFRKPASVPIQEATAFLVISEKAITMTGISGSNLLIGKATKKAGSKESRGKQSIYRCQHCGYISEQKAQGATHVRSEHLGHCLQCRLCDYRTFCSVDFKPHLLNKHPGRSNEWFEPLPDLSHIVATEVEPKDIIIGAKEETPADSDAESNSDSDQEKY